MVKITLNEDLLEKGEVEEEKIKCRCIFIDEQENILIANYGGTYLLPGGKMNKEETLYEAVEREIKEELGMIISEEELEPLVEIEFYQKNYPKVDNTTKNRLITTYYFVSKVPYYIDQKNQKLSKNEKKNNFRLTEINTTKLKEILKTDNANQRSKYFNLELTSVLETLDKYKHYKTPQPMLRKRVR